MNSIVEICKAFDAKASVYDDAALVQYEIGTRLFERLDYLKIDPRFILDVGCGTGVFSERLKKRYPKATIVGLDVSFNMLKGAKERHTWRNKWPLIGADMQHIPFAEGTFDLIFANQVIHWSTEIPAVVRELSRVLRISGCVMFSTLGPDTFIQIRQAFSNVDPYAHTNSFLDLHDLGDILLSEHWLDPVVDMEMLDVNYPKLSSLLRALKSQGVRNIHFKRLPGLMGRRRWRQFEETYRQLFMTKEGAYPLTYEVIYGHAWKGASRRTSLGIETMIPIAQIKRK